MTTRTKRLPDAESSGESHRREQGHGGAGATSGKTYGLDCPIAKTLDAIGDRWTLLIIRDLLRGIHKYQDLLDSLTGISTNLLAERLARLTDEGIVVRTLYSEKPPRAEYHLTEQGEQLAAVVDALFEWGVKYRGWGQSPALRNLREQMIADFGLKPSDIHIIGRDSGSRPARRTPRLA